MWRWGRDKKSLSGPVSPEGWKISMAKRKATRKKTAASARKKPKKGTAIRKRTKKSRNVAASRGKTAKKKTTREKGPSRKKTAKKKATVNKPATKPTVNKEAAKKKAVTKAKVTKPPTRKETVKKKVSKRKTAKKRAFKRKFARGEGAGKEEPGLPLKEVRARLGLIGPQIAALRWLDGLYLYGSALLEEARLERVSFIAVYRGLRSGARLKAAEAELRELIAAVLPVEFDVSTGSPGIGRLLGEGNPAAQAHLGHSEPVFTRDA